MRSDTLTSPLAFLTALFLIGNAGWAIAAAHSVALSPGFLSLYTSGVQWALAWWVLTDCRKRRIPTSIDHGWFVFLAWPVAVPYHLFASRGARGLLVLAGMLGLYVATLVPALALFFVLP